MMLTFSICCAIFLSALSAAQTPFIDINRYPPQPQATTCGDIVHENLYEGEYLFYASDVFDCLTSVPFNPAVATIFLQYLNETFQFHATTAYIRNPPPGYQQPPFDFFGTLDAIGNRVQAGVYHNQYAFETDVQSMIRGLHDTHAFVNAGISSQFTFSSPFRLASVSLDGREAPKVYIYDDLIEQLKNHSYTASAVSTIDGINAIDYLKAFARQQSFGMLEPHADWNQLMVSPAQELFGSSSFSDVAPFYAGNDMNITFEDTRIAAETGSWAALYASPGFTGPLETGGDFYNYFVLGLYPANYDAAFSAYSQNHTSADPTLTPGDDTDNTNITSWHASSEAYPANTMMHQQDLGLFSNGILTGYYIASISTAVLSLPSFDQYGDGINTFVQAITDFVNNATELKAQKIIIDLQQNDGGLAGLAFTVFDQFFTNTRPFAGSRMRSQPDANVLGGATTSFFQNLPDDPRNSTFQDYEADEWVVTDRINALTGELFASWSQYYGPLHYNGDNFSPPQQYNLSNPSFFEAAFGFGVDPCFYHQSCPAVTGWHPSDIVLLTDGICGSTCSLFVEMMREQGVRSVAVGGLPDDGPMQAAAGSRGAADYSGEELWYDFSSIQEINTTAAASLPSTPPNTGIDGVSTGFTLRDQIQRNETVPNQVIYLPADCRLYWTFANFYNYTRLWHDVHDAMFADPSLCVAGSRNAAAPQPTAQSSQNSSSMIGDYIVRGFETSWSDTKPIANGTYELPGVFDDNEQKFITFCTLSSRNNECRNTNLPSCYEMDFKCHGTPDPTHFSMCSKRCVNNDDGSCGQGRAFSCQPTGYLTSKKHRDIGNGKSRVTEGFCEPRWGQIAQGKSCRGLTENNLVKTIMSQAQ